MGSRWPVAWQLVSTSIINPQPLTVTANTPVMKVLEQMSQLHGAACTFPVDPEESLLQASCAIVIDSTGQLVGIFTERDLVKLMVEGQDIALACIGDVLCDSPVTISPEQCQDISAPLYLMRRAMVQHLPVVNVQQKVLGIVTLGTLCQAIEATNFLQLWSVQAVMSTEVVCAAPSMSILEVACQMHAHHTSCAVVIDQQQRMSHPIGIITERDILQLQTLGIPTTTTFVEQVMSSPLFFVDPRDSLWSVYQQMHHHHIRRMVVVDSNNSNHLLGIVNQDDLLHLFDPLAMNETPQVQVEPFKQEKINLLQDWNHGLEQQQQLLEDIILAKDRAQLLEQQNLRLQQEIKDKEQAEAELNQQIEQERLLRLITQDIHSTRDIKELQSLVVNQVRQTVRADRALLFRLMPGGGGIILEESVLPSYPAMEELDGEDQDFPPECYEFYLQRKPRIVLDLHQDDWSHCLKQFWMPAQVKSKIVAPIVQSQNHGHKRLWGLLVVHACDYPRVWQPDEALFLQQVANQFAVAIQQADLAIQLQQELVERQQSDLALAQELQRSQLLGKITQKIHESLDSLYVFETAVVEIRRALKASRCNIFVYSAADDPHFSLMFHDYEADYPDQGPEIVRLADHEYVRQLANQPEAIASPQAQSDPLLASCLPMVAALSIQSMVSIRTSYQGNVNGAITISQCDRIRDWTPEELDLLTAVATEVGIALAHANLLTQELHQREQLSQKNQQLHTEIEEKKQTQTLLKLVMDSIPQAIFWKDRTSRYLGCNRAFAKEAGFNTAEEIIGKTDQEMPWPPEEAEWYRLSDLEVINSNQPQFHVLETQLRADGTKTWMDTNKVPLHNPKGKVVGVLGTAEDITERIQVEAELQQQLQREQVLSEITNQIRQSLDLDILLKSAVEQLCALFQVSRCSFFTYTDQPNPQLVLSAQAYSQPEWEAALSHPLLTSDHPRFLKLLANDRVRPVSDIWQEPSLATSEKESLSSTLRIRAYLSVRTAFKNHPNGIIFLDQCERRRNWTKDEVSLLGTVAAQLGIAVAHADLLADEQKQRQDLKLQNRRLQEEIAHRNQAEKALAKQLEKAELLEQIVQQIRQSLEPQLIFRTAVTQVRQLLAADRVCIYRFIEDTDHAQGMMVAEEVLPEFPSALTAHVRDRCFGDQYANRYQSGRFQAVADIHEAGLSDCHIEILAQFHIRANLVLPLLQGDNLWGLLCIHQCSGPRSWQPDEIEFVQKIANQLGIALYQAELLLKEQHQRHVLSVRSQELTFNNQQLATAKQEAETAQKKAEQANRAKSTFLANMSHELRTPLNAILGFSQLISRDPSTPNYQLEQLEIINRSGEHLLALINDVLTMSKIEAGRSSLHSQIVDLPLLLDTVESMLGIKAKQKRLTLLINRGPNPPQYIRTDPGKLRQVLMNLLSNAIKFTTSGHVQLHLESSALDTSESSDAPPLLELRFTVTDTGSGIAPEELKLLFEPFAQTETGRQSQEGTGLGLAISRQFVQLMGGNLTAQSIHNQGTTFTFNIVVEKVLQQKQSLSHRQFMGLLPDQPQYRILVVEDNMDSRELLVTLLETIGFTVKAAKNGEVAVTLCQSWQPDLVWMDLRLPILDGLSATRLIKQMENPPVVIALTANAFDEDRDLALRAGCDDFVHKPYREASIFKKMALHLEVEYHYQDKVPLKSTIPTLNVDHLAQMPHPWLVQLHQATNNLDQHMVELLLDELDDTAQPLQEALRHLVYEFRYDEILAVTHPLISPLPRDSTEQSPQNGNG